MLENDLYTLLSADPIEGRFRLAFDARCEIYCAHFPGNPITPGVCLVETVRELSCRMLPCSVRIARALNVKYLSLLSPRLQPQVDVRIALSSAGQNEWIAKADITVGEQTFTRMSLLLRRDDGSMFDTVDHD